MEVGQVDQLSFKWEILLVMGKCLLRVEIAMITATREKEEVG